MEALAVYLQECSRMLPGMKLVLGEYSSCAFWRSVYPCDRTPGDAMRHLDLHDCVYSKRDIDQLAPKWTSIESVLPPNGMIDAITQSHKDRRQTVGHVVRAIPGAVPEGSFYQLSDNVYICSPSYVFLLMAKRLSFPKLVALGYELCGLYSLDRRSERGIRQRKAPLLCIERLRSYVEGAKGVQGCSRALRALGCVQELCASPMETECAMLACMPYRYGGYGLKKFSINHEIRLVSGAFRIAGKRTCYGDLCYPDEGIDIEFQGKYDHAPQDKYDADRARVNAIRMSGYNVIELTSGQVGDLRSFEAIMLSLARATSKRIDKRYLGPTPARVELRRELFEWSASCGW